LFTISFIISLIRVATFVIFAFLIERIYFQRNLSSEKVKIFNYNSRNNLSSYIIIALSISTILNTSENSYIFKVNSSLAIYGPWFFILTGLIMYVRNLKFNILLKRRLLK
jgi:hypothetical protein